MLQRACVPAPLHASEEIALLLAAIVIYESGCLGVGHDTGKDRMLTTLRFTKSDPIPVKAKAETRIVIRGCQYYLPSLPGLKLARHLFTL